MAVPHWWMQSPWSPRDGCSMQGWGPSCPFLLPTGWQAWLSPSWFRSVLGSSSCQAGNFSCWSCSGKCGHPLALFIILGHSRREACLGKGMVCQGIVFSQRELVRKPFFYLCCWLLLSYFLKIYFSPPQHICTEWEIKAAVNNVLAHRKVPEHTPSSCTASTWGNYQESFKMELFCASVWL